MQKGDEILTGSFLEIRAKLLEVAATLDRVDRALDQGETLEGDAAACRAKLDDSIRILLTSDPDRAERLQRLFSREFSDAWRQEFEI
ncbi:hypothetical protein OAA27_01590 [bacterium]|nr:hypothetical protein [bacterium]